MMHIYQGDLRQAVTLLNKGVVAAYRSKDELQLIRILDLLGWAHRAKGEHGKSLEYCAKERSLAEGCGFRSYIPLARCNAGLEYLAQGKKDKALENLQKAHELGSGFGCARLDARIADGLGSLYAKRKEWTEAEASFEAAEKALAGLKDPWALGSHHMLVGDMHARRGLRREAKEAYAHAVDAFKRLGNEMMVAEVQAKIKDI